MDAGRRTQYRKQLTIAIGLSVGVHAVALTALKLHVPDYESETPGRALTVVDIPSEWENAAMEVVALESAPSSQADGAAAAAEATSAAADLADPGSAGAGSKVAALMPLVDLPGASPNAPAVAMTRVEAAPVATVALASTRRGVIKRVSGGGAAGSSGFDFVATSDAAREAERERGGGGRGGLGGIGVTILGGGGEAHCPTWGGVPLIGGRGLGIGR